MSSLLKWIIGFFLVVCIGWVGFMLSHVPDQEGFTPSTMQSRTFLNNIYSMYSHNKITASAAVLIVKDYLKTVPEEDFLDRIREIIKEDAPNTTNAERMKQMRDELKKPVDVISTASEVEDKAVDLEDKDAVIKDAAIKDAVIKDAVIKDAVKDTVDKEMIESSELAKPESIVPIVPVDRNASLTDAPLPTVISPVVPMSGPAKLPGAPHSTVLQTSSQLKESFQSRYMKAKDNYKLRV